MDAAAPQAKASPQQARPKEATRVVPTQRDAHGNPYWESYMTPDSFGVRAEAQIPPHLPGVIIFVHGVNSEGEWYDAAEKALCEGLNERLGLGDSEFRLRENKYLDQVPGTPRIMHERRYVSNDPGRSPVIRFFWGYREPEAVAAQGKYKVPLRNISGVDFAKRSKDDQGPWFWGGGPFQNGTNNLQQMWSGKGFSRHLFGVVNLQLLNTEPERQLQDAPARDYYPHAAQRLANLIDKIRARYPHDTITVMSHSQGTMIAMAAAALCSTRAPDALFLMNSPFALDDKITDFATSGNDRPTAAAREKTFRNIANRIRADRRMLDDRLKGLLQVGKTPDGKPWRPDAQLAPELAERDNHGRLYVYFSPHDRVMGMSALESIGWQGVSSRLLEELGETVKQRMLARLTPCGDTPGIKRFGTLPDMKGGDLADPKSPKEFWDGNRGPIFNGIKLWTVPSTHQTVHINAEAVPRPLTPAELSAFDESVDEAREMGAIRPDNGEYYLKEYPYMRSVYEGELYKDRGEDIYSGNQRIRTKETDDEARERLSTVKAEPPDHSTLPSDVNFMSRVAAYDLPIGFCESFEDRRFWRELTLEADWTQMTDAYFTNGILLRPEMPSAYIDEEAVADAIAAKAHNDKFRGA